MLFDFFFFNTHEVIVSLITCSMADVISNDIPNCSKRDTC